MNAFDQLTELLRQLPGIGPRQARRLAFFLVRKDATWVERFAHTLTSARNDIAQCALCMRLHPRRPGAALCDLCADEARETRTLMIVEKDVDLENIERTGVYTGRYFVLGGTAGPLDKNPEKRIRILQLEALLTQHGASIEELIFALSATTEGEDTLSFVHERIQPHVERAQLKITVLGRGLSTGTELEYVDRDTMQSALRGRN